MPAEFRDSRRTLRYRHLLVKQMVQMENRVSGLLMETGIKSRLLPRSLYNASVSELMKVSNSEALMCLTYRDIVTLL